MKKRLLVALVAGLALAGLGRLAAGGGLDEWAGARMRALIAALALAWVLFVRARRRAGRPLAPTAAHGVLGAIAIAAWAAWFDFGAMPPTGGVHRHDVFHYYVGAKYHRELGYALLYRCTAVAEAEDGREAEVRQRQMRDLVTLRIVLAAEALADPAACRARFSDERWRAFREDVSRFRAGLPEAKWRETQTDHGYNPSPAWTVTTGALARVAPSTDTGLRALALLDVLLLLGAVAALHRAFGLRVAALALILWGTQEPAKFTWIAFAMGRTDWLFLLVASLSLLRLRRPALAGAALGCAAMMRVFPAIGLLGVVLAGVASPAIRARFAPARRRFVAGFLAAAVALVALGGAVAGPSSWMEWAHHLRRHTAGASSNDVGLGVIVAFDRSHRLEAVQERMPSAAPEVWQAQWSQGVRDAHAARRLPTWGMRLGFVALLLVALARVRRPWMGLALAVLAAPVLSDFSGYYLMLFIVAAVLVPGRPSLLRGLLAFAAGVEVLMVMPAIGWFVDDRHFVLSLAYVGAAAAISLAFARRRRST